MLLKPMRFKDYTWPHNPEIYAVEYRRQIAAHKIPLGGWYLQDLGRTYRIFRGEGTFAGERAYEEFQTLAEVFDQTGPGLLVHPVWRTVSAYFVTLELMEEPLPDYVRYRFSFWEDSTASGGLVEVPCVYRNVGASGIAFTAADMVLSGIRCPIEPDEVILAMKEVGDALPTSLRETGEGGCAACESICKRLHHKE